MVENKGKTLRKTSLGSSMPISNAEEDANAFVMLNDGSNINSACESETLDDSITASFHDAKDTDDLSPGNSKNEELIKFVQCEESGVYDKNEKLDIHSISLTGASSDSNSQLFENNVGEAQISSQAFKEREVNPGGNDFVLSTVVTHSGQICRVSLLEDIIAEAKNHKNVLFLAMESVINLIKEVEIREKDAQDAKDAASRGGLEVIENVKEMKKMLKHAKEANEMHAGEVYGEKSILATEVRELQTRLLGLSDAKDDSLSILDEMREVLNARLIEAEEERRVVEQELLAKKECAQVVLSEQELIMEKVVQESKLLQQEAQESNKLRDFLVDKGRLVDILQGEISVVCQDVKSLKENFDNGVSPSKSSFKQTINHLASSNSSVKSMVSDQAVGWTYSPESPTPSRASRPILVECQTPRSSVNEQDVTAAGAADKALWEDGWEFFDC